jgi:hypothetical protein
MDDYPDYPEYDDYGCSQCEQLRDQLEDQRIESDGARRALVALATRLEEDNSDLRLMLKAMVDIVEGYIDGLAEEDQWTLQDAVEMLKNDSQDS